VHDKIRILIKHKQGAPGWMIKRRKKKNKALIAKEE
jgi:hypothetical protein